MSVKKPSAEMTGAEMEAKFLDMYKRLTPDGKDYMIRLMFGFACDPGFTEAYKALPNALGQNCPSKEDVERLMEKRRKEAQA